ncbi:hypothetical protein FHS82_001278 [Pseudochelatococcus lubricantis]|uniref:Uncharacterized protein n=1 Tax=Pseudochelatococcus lubricantis TaxID=1538102 RepID=A0ABX0UWY0_9HYPH|nr:hypothetical protein [Pseudochelatococcus lubricantis]NIJ57452.1 hypothetical protein [Pseudochelatococcus lubricantis]
MTRPAARPRLSVGKVGVDFWEKSGHKPVSVWRCLSWAPFVVLQQPKSPDYLTAVGMTDAVKGASGLVARVSFYSCDRSSGP